jgi:hypothetical protein
MWALFSFAPKCNCETKQRRYAATQFNFGVKVFSDAICIITKRRDINDLGPDYGGTGITQSG